MQQSFKHKLASRPDQTTSIASLGALEDFSKPAKFNQSNKGKIQQQQTGQYRHTDYDRDVRTLVEAFAARVDSGSPASFACFKECWQKLHFSCVYQAGIASRQALDTFMQSIYTAALDFIDPAVAAPLSRPQAATVSRQGSTHPAGTAIAQQYLGSCSASAAAAASRANARMQGVSRVRGQSRQAQNPFKVAPETQLQGAIPARPRTSSSLGRMDSSESLPSMCDHHLKAESGPCDAPPPGSQHDTSHRQVMASQHLLTRSAAALCILPQGATEQRDRPSGMVAHMNSTQDCNHDIGYWTAQMSDVSRCLASPDNILPGCADESAPDVGADELSIMPDGLLPADFHRPGTPIDDKLPASLVCQIGGLFTVYAVYTAQPCRPKVRIYLVLELLEALVNLLAECNDLGFLEPKAMVARLVADEALVMGAVRRHLPGSVREKPIRHRTSKAVGEKREATFAAFKQILKASRTLDRLPQGFQLLTKSYRRAHDLAMAGTDKDGTDAQEHRPTNSLHQTMQAASEAFKSKRAKLIRVPAKPERRHGLAAAEHAHDAPGPANHAVSQGAAETTIATCNDDLRHGQPTRHGDCADEEDLELALMAELDRDDTPNAAASLPCVVSDISKPAAAGKKRRKSASRQPRMSMQEKATAQMDANEALPSELADIEEAAETSPAAGMPAQDLSAHAVMDSAHPDQLLKSSPQPHKLGKQPSKPPLQISNDVPYGAAGTMTSWPAHDWCPAVFPALLKIGRDC
ncbi:hypothetical protein WJX74_010579 [Apatococcus lobatus]|uniref:Uncharacterized protein n=1 Tax=Apatococcus lobatus TaxID=904363 RepID=A0AAW1RAH0_9CHLO